MKRVGDVELKLARGPIPHYYEIKKLATAVVNLMEHEFGTKEVIKRFSDPLWYNSFACLLGFEWNYSGMTTVILNAIKEGLQETDSGLVAFGGKGKKANAVEEIDKSMLSDKIIYKLKNASIFTAKIDNNLIQDNYDLYFHFLLADEKGNYTIINQKLNVIDKKVRRFHWINSNDFLNDDTNSIGNKTPTLNLSGKENKEVRKSILDLIHEYKPKQIKQYIIRLSNSQLPITHYFIDNNSNSSIIKIYQRLPKHFKIPKKVYWDALKIAETVDNFYDFIKIKGMGRGLLRALAYTTNLVYGTELSWNDPIKYTFAHGTKVGKPYYINKKIMIEEAELIKNAIEESRLNNNFKLRVLKQLQRFTKDVFYN